MAIDSEILREEPPRPTAETPEAKVKRIANERELIEHAREDVRLGRCIPDEDVDAWLDRLIDSDAPMPIPDGPSSAHGTK